MIKPYNYIDKVKEGFEKEWAETKKKLTANNEKYMGKFINLETNVNKLLTDTHSLVDQYKKKISDIGRDLSSVKEFKEHIERLVDGTTRAMVTLSDGTKNDIG